MKSIGIWVLMTLAKASPLESSIAQGFFGLYQGLYQAFGLLGFATTPLT
jgi:hypothetical protein